MVDTDNNGYLERHELANMFKGMEGYEYMTDAQLDEFISQADLNNDGVIDMKEFITAVSEESFNIV